MNIQNVDQLVDEVMKLVALVRPRVSEDHRMSQWQTLVNLCTRTTIDLPDTNDFNIKRGSLLELLVMSQPDYPQLSTEERQASDYLLACMRPGQGLPRVGKSKSGLKNPDDLVTSLDGNTLHITAIIEIKHNTAPHKRAFSTQLESFEDSVKRVGAALDRRLRGRKQPPRHSDYPWPKTIKCVILDPDFKRIIYLPSDRFKSLAGWEVRHSVFSKKEIEGLVNGKFWDRLARGGAKATETTKKRLRPVTIRRSPDVAASVRQTGAIDVHEHDGEELIPVANPSAQSVERPDGKAGYYFIHNAAADWTTIQEDLVRRLDLTVRESARVVSELSHRLSEWDGQAAKKEVDARLVTVATTMQHIPSKGLLARFEIDAARSSIQLAGARALLEAIKQDPKAKKLPRTRELEQILKDRERKLAGGEDVEEEAGTFEPTDSDAKVTHNGSLFMALLSHFDDVFGDLVRQRNIERLRSMGVEIDKVDEVLASAPAPTSTPAAAAIVDKVCLNEACEKHGQPVVEGTNFCGKCGTKLSEPAPEPAATREGIMEEEARRSGQSVPVPGKCSKCSVQNQESDKFCRDCGANLAPAAPVEPPPEPIPTPVVAAMDAPAPKPAPTSVSKPFCPGCGNKRNDNANFCPICGMKYAD